MRRNKKRTPEMVELLRRAGDTDPKIALAAQQELALALTTPLRRGVLRGDILGNIFELVELEPGVAPDFPFDLLSPGSEKDFVAYTIPNVGRIPERAVQGDYVTVPTYDTGNSIDCSLKFLRDARWDVMDRMYEVIEGGFVRKFNNDGWHVLLAAAVARGIVVYDDAAPAGLFTPRELYLMEISMRRNGGGNSTSQNRGKLTDLYVSPESRADAKSWDLTQVPDEIRRKIYSMSDGIVQIGDVNIHDLDELGVGQEYQLYYTATLGGTMPTDKKEIMVGLDLQNTDSFVMPVREGVEIFPDEAMHRQRRAGLYGWSERGFGALDNRRVILGAA